MQPVQEASQPRRQWKARHILVYGAIALLGVFLLALLLFLLSVRRELVDLTQLLEGDRLTPRLQQAFHEFFGCSEHRDLMAETMVPTLLERLRYSQTTPIASEPQEKQKKEKKKMKKKEFSDALLQTCGLRRTRKLGGIVLVSSHED